MLLLALPALVLPLCQGPRLRPVLLEDFDQPGTTWAATLFPAEVQPGGFARSPLTAAMGAPDTFPPLPINVGGDLEARFGDDVLTFTGGDFALAADTPENRFEEVAVRGVVATAANTPLGSEHVGFVLRASLFTNSYGSVVNSYTAFVETIQTTGTGQLWLARWNYGVITFDDIFAAGTFPLEPGPGNYLLDFRAEGTLLTARLWRISEQQGEIVVAPVQLAGGAGPHGNQLSARDGALRSGRVGLYGFARSGNLVFWDDVEVGFPGDRSSHVVQPPGPLLPPDAASRRP